jgi:signal transduction histidine kinase/ligand-binding sensor domain-containing protein
MSLSGRLRYGSFALLLTIHLQAAVASSWFMRPWQADDGLPGDTVSGVVQSADGYLWFTTQSGLARFDGVRILSVPLPIGRAQPIIFAMLLDRSGQFWLAQEAGVLVRMRGNAAVMLTRTNGLSRAQPLELVQTRDEAVWISYADGVVCRVRNEQVTRFDETNGPPGSGACCVATDERGELWFARGGQVGIYRQNQFVTLFTLPERFVHLRAARGGGMWINAGGRLLKYAGGAAAIELGRIDGDSVPRPMALYEDSSGILWIGTSASGLFTYDGKVIEQVPTSHARIRTITEDREGNIWVGTDGGGLNRLRRQVVEVQGKEEGLPFDTVRSVAEDPSGAIWAVLQDAQLARKDANGWKTISSTKDWPGGQATCVAADTNGVVWIGTYLRGLYRWQDGKFTVLRRNNGLAASSIRSLLVDREGSLWIAYSTGDTLQRYREGKFQDFELPANSRPIRTMCEDAAGNIWMANLDAQLLRLSGDLVVDETARTTEPYRPIRCLIATPDGSLWLGYSSVGLGRLKDGRFTRINQERGLQDNSICSLMPDDRGWMWLGSDHGIFRANLEELHAVADGEAAFVKCIGYGRDESLPSLQAYYGYSPGPAKTRDGRILIPTRLGLAVARPDLVQTNYVAPPVIIESALVDSRELLGTPTAGAVRLPPSHRKLEFHYTAPSFIDAENIRFRYRLEGFDDDWLDAGRERVARYPRLAAGTYEFRVQAENNAGVVNEAGATFRFVVTPFFWQHWWFIAGAVVFFTTAIFVVARYVSVRRLRLKVQQLERENALQKERARIAHDIHDDIGARMTQISLLAELTQQAITNPERAGEHVAQIAGMTRQGMKALDEIVWAVNPRNDTLQDLLDYGGQYAMDFLGAAGVRCRVDFPAVPLAQNLPADLRHALLMVLKEALNNVVKHAQATEVWLRVNLQGAELRWQIEDNGRGFSGVLPEDAFADGLRNMRQRLAEFGGSCAIESQPGAGVKITFVVAIGAGAPAGPPASANGAAPVP